MRMRRGGLERSAGGGAERGGRSGTERNGTERCGPARPSRSATLPARLLPMLPTLPTLPTPAAQRGGGREMRRTQGNAAPRVAVPVGARGQAVPAFRRLGWHLSHAYGGDIP